MNTFGILKRKRAENPDDMAALARDEKGWAASNEEGAVKLRAIGLGSPRRSKYITRGFVRGSKSLSNMRIVYMTVLLLIMILSATVLGLSQKLSKRYTNNGVATSTCSKVQNAISSLKTYSTVSLILSVLLYVAIISTNFFDPSASSNTGSIALTMNILYGVNIAMSITLCGLFGKMASLSATLQNNIKTCFTNKNESLKGTVNHLFGLTVSTSVFSGLVFIVLTADILKNGYVSATEILRKRYSQEIQLSDTRDD